MLNSAGESSKLDILILWDILQSLLIPIWPKDRTAIGGNSLGDAWPLSTLHNQVTALDDNKCNLQYIQPFHKLTQ